ncbi:MAG TPA: GNAT family N-acetyltransferase [Aestuariivirgaceae bacterium]
MRIQICSSLNEIDASTWNAQANPSGLPYNPFVDHAFLLALEQSGSATRKTGWLGQHLLLQGDDGRMLGAMPCYLKSHSHGEYVFDYAFAEALERAGGRYYPKLQVSVPFTPVTGPRLMAPPGPQEERCRKYLLGGALELCSKLSASSLHITFPPENEWHLLGTSGMLQRTDIQFHWQNHEYGRFEDYLSELSSTKRKNIRKERDAVRKAGIHCEWVTGSDLTEAHWDAFFRCYMDTGSRKWGSPYLTRKFFSLVSASMADKILLVLCRRNNRPIGGALNFIGSATLYGRNWGAIEHHPMLHFEACYYQAIEFAISRGLKWVEAGAQGPHKLARGYLPKTTYSAHYFAEPQLAHAAAKYLEHERRAIAEDQSALDAHSPFRNRGAAE